MELKEYKEQLEQLNKEFDNKKKELQKKCAFENNPFNIGDIICDTNINVIIKVEKIGAYTPFSSEHMPMCTYTGPQLKKDLSPRIDGQYYTLYQSDKFKKIK